MIFDSGAAQGTGQGLYLECRAYETNEVELPAALFTFYSGIYEQPPSEAEMAMRIARYSGSSPRRLYHAHVESMSILDPKRPTSAEGVVDYRVAVPLLD